MLRNAKQTVQLSSRDMQWYFVALVTAAIAISYFDRQTLPVAISAIQRTIPLNNQQFRGYSLRSSSPTQCCMQRGDGCWILWEPAEASF
jgi:hypothetical protein